MKILAALLIIFDLLLAFASSPFIAAYTVIMFVVLVIPMGVSLMSYEEENFRGPAPKFFWILWTIVVWPFRIWKSLLPESIRNWKL